MRRFFRRRGLRVHDRETHLEKLKSSNELLVAHPFFDADWYVRRYQDVADAGIHPLQHYLKFGAREGRDPNPLFDTNWYLQQHPDVAEAGINPLLHWFGEGISLGYWPHPVFASAWKGK